MCGVTRRFRLSAFDNDYMTYLDMNIDNALLKPVFMVTNPPVGVPAVAHA